MGVVVQVVSGGQSGVDRAALEAAARLGLSYAGWCPRGGRAEDATEPPGVRLRFPRLRETAETDPTVRTRLNVRDSGAVLVLRPPRTVSPGTDLTQLAARRWTVRSWSPTRASASASGPGSTGCPARSCWTSPARARARRPASGRPPCAPCWPSWPARPDAPGCRGRLGARRAP